jgi:tetratricopeptide (TPR) repeat protein
MNKPLLAFAALFLIFCYSFGQTNKEIAYEKAIEAIELMDNGEYEKSIQLLREAEKLDKGNIFYPYEIALAYSMDKQYKKSNKILKKLLKHDDVFDQVYQMIGINYSYSNNRNKAIEFFDKGLSLFPNSGYLHLERGNMERFVENYDEALTYYEKGIEVAPNYPSNYYWAALFYLSSSEEVWGMIYGETFMNLERNSKRTVDISKLLFETYKNEIVFTNDTSFSVSFSKQAILDINALLNQQSFELPFGIGVYEPTLMFSIIAADVDEINISSLNSIRKKFVDIYFDNEHHVKYPFPLFEYQKIVKDAGHMDAYNHWILMQGDVEGFKHWNNHNKKAWDDFVEWFLDNPMKIEN